MKLLQAILDVFNPRHPRHNALLNRMKVREARIMRNLLLLDEPYSGALMAATDEAAEFGDVGKH